MEIILEIHWGIHEILLFVEMGEGTYVSIANNKNDTQYAPCFCTPLTRTS